MGAITVRNLPDDVIDRLKQAAAANGRSMEQEVRDLLEQRYASRDAILDRARRRWPEDSRVTAEELDQWRRQGRP